MERMLSRPFFRRVKVSVCGPGDRLKSGKRFRKPAVCLPSVKAQAEFSLFFVGSKKFLCLPAQKPFHFFPEFFWKHFHRFSFLLYPAKVRPVPLWWDFPVPGRHILFFPGSLYYGR